MEECELAAFVAAFQADLMHTWREAMSLYADERVYCFGPYTVSGASYFTSTVSSEQGLKTVVSAYIERSQDSDPVLQAASLRWSPCDSPRHALAGSLPRVTALLDARAEVDEGVADQIFETAVSALQLLDHASVFGEGAARSALTLCLWMGDQSDEQRLAYVRRLNTAEVSERFALEQEAAGRAWNELRGW